MAESFSEAESFLLSVGVAEAPSALRRAVLGCLACRWFRGSEMQPAYGYEIGKCLGGRSIRPYLYELETGGVVTSEFEPSEAVAHPTRIGITRPQRRLYTPADTFLGQAFVNTLRMGETCPINEIEIERLDVLLSTLATASAPPQIETLVTLTTERLDQS